MAPTGGRHAHFAMLDQARERMRVKHYSLRTEEAYLHWIRRFVLYHGKRHPRDLGAAEVEAFLSRLATERRFGVHAQSGTGFDRRALAFDPSQMAGHCSG